MTWYQGTMNAGATNRQTFLETILHPALLAEGWEYVKEWAGTNSAVARTYRCPAALAGGAEFFVSFARTSATTTISFSVHGKFDPATNASDYLPYFMSNGQTPAMRANGTLNQTATTNLFDSIWDANISITDAAFNYHLKVKPNYLVLGTPASGGTYFIGRPESWVTPPADIPFACAVNLPNGGSNGGATWTPGVTTAGNIAGGASCSVINPNLFAQPNNGGPDYVSGRVALIDTYLRSVLDTSPQGGVYGKLPEVAWANFSGGAYGDLVTTAAGDWFMSVAGPGYAIKKT